MKNILIAVERIGAEDTKLQDEKIVEFVRELADENIIHVYASSIVLNEYGDYLRAKGIELHTQSITPVANISQEFDVVVAFDVWGVKNSGQFQVEKKIRVSKESTLESLSNEINKKAEKPESKPKPALKPRTAKPATSKPKK
jgi:hypothetical protein